MMMLTRFSSVLVGSLALALVAIPWGSRALPQHSQQRFLAGTFAYAVGKPHLMNDVVRRIIGIEDLWTNHMAIYGAGQIVALADTGIDTGSNDTISADFKGRIGFTHALARHNDWSDVEGHGTSIAGSIAGSGVLSGANPATHTYTGTLAGMAPEATLDIQSIANATGDLTGIPDNLGDLFAQAYADGARIHNDSWGTIPEDSSGQPSPGAYDSLAQQVDQFVWTHPDMLIVVAAGNDGADKSGRGIVDPGSIASPADAKDDLAVGASESLRPPHTGAGGYADLTWGYPAGWGDSGNPTTFTKDPIASSYVSANINGMAPTSSRGPAADGRIKPDISTPATNVASDKSSVAPMSAYWGAVPGRPGYAYSGGTSIAAGIVSGAAALLRDYLMTQAPWLDNDPSAAVMKALLLNEAHDMYPGQYGIGPQQEMTTRPNSVEGWGRLDVGAIISPSSLQSVMWDDHTAGLTTNMVVSYPVTVTTASQPFHATLAWSDYPGALYASKELVNDLDLQVIGPAGQVYWGNNATGGDRVNTVETVDIPWATQGVYTVTVIAHSVTQSRQPFGLAVSAAAPSVNLAQMQVDGVMPSPPPTAITTVTETATAGASPSATATNATAASPQPTPSPIVTATSQIPTSTPGTPTTSQTLPSGTPASHQTTHPSATPTARTGKGSSVTATPYARQPQMTPTIPPKNVTPPGHGGQSASRPIKVGSLLITIYRKFIQETQVARIIVQGHAHITVSISVSIARHAPSILIRTLDGKGHLQLDVPFPSQRLRGTTQLKITVDIGSHPLKHPAFSTSLSFTSS